MLQPLNFCIPEDLEDYMTLHVGLIGSNGFVIASDTLRTWMSPSSPNNPQRSSTKKIRVQDGLVWACAGYQPHTEFGEQLLHSMGSQPFSESILRDFTLTFFRDNVVNKQTEEILVGHRSQPAQLWQIKAYPRASQILPDVTAAWDRATNQAAVCAHFIPTLFHLDAQKPTNDLVFPAALTIWYGERENNGAIRGLQIVKCVNGSIEQLDNLEIRQIQRRCSEFHQVASDFIYQVASLSPKS